MEQNNRSLGWTTIEEAKQLVEAGLPVETADMYYWLAEEREYVYTGKCSDPNGIPCWSLGALVSMLPLNIPAKNSLSSKYDLEFKLYSGYIVAYCIGQSHHPIVSTEKHESLIKACIEMIIWLLKNKLI